MTVQVTSNRRLENAGQDDGEQSTVGEVRSDRTEWMEWPFSQDLRAEHGYDTQGDHLSLSAAINGGFFRLSRSIVQSPSFNPKNVVHGKFISRNRVTI